MPWPSSAPTIEVAFCRTKCDKMAVIHQDYYFHHNRKYKGGDYWCCAHRGCKVRLISTRMDPETGRMEFARRNHNISHQHPPNAPNLVEKEFRRQLISQFDRKTIDSNSPASVRLVYDDIRAKAIQRGIPETLIPSFWNVRSIAYRLKRKRTDNNSQTISGGESKETESSSESEATSSESVQSEPLSLVTWRNPCPSPPRQQLAPLLYQQLNTSLTSPSSSSSSSFNNNSPVAPIPPVIGGIAPWFSRTPEPPLMMRPDYLMFYPGRAPNPFMMQHFAALHAEYLRSLYAINNHHFA